MGPAVPNKVAPSIITNTDNWMDAFSLIVILRRQLRKRRAKERRGQGGRHGATDADLCGRIDQAVPIKGLPVGEHSFHVYAVGKACYRAREMLVRRRVWLVYLPDSFVARDADCKECLAQIEQSEIDQRERGRDEDAGSSDQASSGNSPRLATSLRFLRARPREDV